MLDRLKQQHAQTNVMASLGAFAVYCLTFLMFPSLALAETEYANAEVMLATVSDQAWADGKTHLFLSIIFYIIGIALIARGLLNAKKQSEGGQGSGLSGWLPILVPVMVGALLIAMPSFIKLVLNSIALDPEDVKLDDGDLAASNATCAAMDGADGGGFENTIGGAICRVYSQFGTSDSNIYTLIFIISIIVGILTVGSALLGAYRIGTGGQGAPRISGVVWRAIGGAMLIALPSALVFVRNTLFGEEAAATANFVFSPFEVTDTGGVDEALTHFIGNIKFPFISLVFFIFIVIGVVTIARTLYIMSGINFEQQKMTPTSMIARLVIGGCLVSSWSIYTTVATTVMGGTPDAVAHTLAYSSEALDEATADQINNILNAALVWVQMIGLLAFFRGFLVLKASLDGQGQGGLGAGMTHIIAGTLCINIPWTIIMIQNTIPGVSMLTPP